MAFRRTSRAVASISAVVLGALLLVIAALVFAGVYLALPGTGHFYALIWIGILALVFAVASYFGSSATRDPSAARLATFGFLGMGFADLVLTITVGPDNPLSTTAQIAALIVVLVLLVGVVVMARWRAGELGREQRRDEQRTTWEQSPPKSAFEYAAAQTATPPPAATSPDASRTPPSGGHA